MPARTPSPARGRGRPSKTPAEQQIIREQILDATRAVFVQRGYHGLSVDFILAEAGLSRPTFYRYFRTTDEPIELILKQVNDDLVRRVKSAATSVVAPQAKLEAVILAWRDWGTDLGALLRPLFSELHDLHSPVSRHRKRALTILRRDVSAAIAATGRPAPARVLLDAVVNGVEFLGYRYHLDTKRDAANWKATRDAMLRLGLGLLGTEDELAMAVPLAKSLDVSFAAAREPRKPRKR